MRRVLDLFRTREPEDPRQAQADAEARAWHIVTRTPKLPMIDNHKVVCACGWESRFTQLRIAEAMHAHHVAQIKGVVRFEASDLVEGW